MIFGGCRRSEITGGRSGDAQVQFLVAAKGFGVIIGRHNGELGTSRRHDRLIAIKVSIQQINLLEISFFFSFRAEAAATAEGDATASQKPSKTLLARFCC